MKSTKPRRKTLGTYFIQRSLFIMPQRRLFFCQILNPIVFTSQASFNKLFIKHSLAYPGLKGLATIPVGEISEKNLCCIKKHILREREKKATPQHKEQLAHTLGERRGTMSKTTKISFALRFS